jgi:hypothetical protein
MEIETLLKKLQSDLSIIDFLTNNRQRNDCIELLVTKLQNIKIKIYQEKGHSTPHIHIDYGKEHHAASYSINDGRRLVGNLSRKYDHGIKNWISNSHESLLVLWETVQKGEQTNEIVAEIQGDTKYPF